MGIKGYSAKSLPARLYRWFWFEKRMPDGLCPYFWKSLIMYLVIIPYSILLLPSVLISVFSDDVKNGGDSHSTRFFASMIIYVGIFVLSSLLYAPTIFWYIEDHQGILGALQHVGAGLWTVGFIIGLVFLIRWGFFQLSNKIYDIRYPNYPREKKPSLVVEFVKAKYNKYCPKIDWEDQEDDYER